MLKHQVTEIKLKNGARGLFIDVPSAPVVAANLYFRAGFRFAKASQYELPHLLEHLAFGANHQFPSEQAYEAEFCQNGAYHNASTGGIALEYTLECADFDFERVFPLQLLGICEPIYQEDKIKTEKNVIKTELTDDLNDHFRVLWQKISTSLGEKIMLDKDRLQTLAAITKKDLQQFHQRTHTSDNFRFVIAGKLSGHQTLLQQTLENLALPRGRLLPLPQNKLQSAPPIFIKRASASNLNFGFSLALNRRLKNHEAIAMRALCHILTGTTYSLIYGDARKCGIIYDLDADFTNGLASCFWDFSGTINQENASRLFTIIKEKLAALLAGELPEEILTAAKSYALGRFQMFNQTTGALADYYSSKYFEIGKIENLAHVPHEIAAVTREQIHALVQEFFSARIWTLGGLSKVQKQDVHALAQIVAPLFENKS